ncbi:hypothetical protein SeMB42_g03838 [Synchytrium endobioticum]|uniref:Uncharacterized protein n=1 Tax=Synchytrium endobioticum TaxID=286115 RepID=A0A507D3D4_9FUNG|nr:hypothetical protein SeMB42_g03838 [Synchytrium endobioticum]
MISLTVTSRVFVKLSLFIVVSYVKNNSITAYHINTAKKELEKTKAQLRKYEVQLEGWRRQDGARVYCTGAE